MPSIADAVIKHQQLQDQGKIAPVARSNEPIYSAIPPSAGSIGNVRGSYQPSQILGGDFARATIVGGPMRSPMFPIPPNTTNNTAAQQAALKAAAVASEAVRIISNLPIVTADGPNGTLQSGSIIPSAKLPGAPAKQKVVLDQVSDGSQFGKVSVQALAVNYIDPSQTGLISRGNRPASLTTTQSFVSTTSSVTFYWDGTNGSQVFQIYRDDGTISSPISGNQSITGLSANTKYYFYMFYDETTQQVEFTLGDGTGVGSPAYAFTSPNLVAAQQQILSHRISLFAAASQGITTPSSGSGGGSGGGGGGGRGGTF